MKSYSDKNWLNIDNIEGRAFAPRRDWKAEMLEDILLREDIIRQLHLSQNG